MSHAFPIHGHDWAAEYLQRSLHHQRVRHAYLISGAPNVGKFTLASAFTRALQCTAADPAARPCGVCRSCKLLNSGNHPDVIYSQTDPTTGTLKIEELRNVMSKLALRPFESRYRVAILADFDRARPAAQDALLKTLEEPPASAVLILLTQSADALLPTILSRCQHLALTLVPSAVTAEILTTHYYATPDKAHLLAQLSGGRLGWAITALHEPEALQQRAAALKMLQQALDGDRATRFQIANDLSDDKLALVPLLELWQTYWRDVVLLSESSTLPPTNIDQHEAIATLSAKLPPSSAYRALKATRLLLSYLQNSVNVNLRLALEILFLDYPINA
jgi:DNA polymerase III subunit delta'